LSRMVCTTFWTVLLLVGHGWGAAPARLNYVVLVADDLAWDDCRPFGNARIQTPNLDKLAKEGMRFELAFLTCSSCSPSRASMLTGRYPHSTGAAELHKPVPGDQVFVTQPLREAGYYTAAAGKWHLGPAAKNKFDLVKERGGPDAYADWLNVIRDRPKEKPFFFWLASTDPHRPYLPQAIAKPHAPSDVTVPPYLPDTPEVRSDLALYYDETARFDQKVGEVLAELNKQGLREQTMVIVISDNGRPFPRCKTTVLDSGIRTPLLIRWPKKIPATSVCKTVVSSLDLVPTILETAGLRPMPTMQGTSLVPLFTNPAAVVRRYAFAEHNWHDYQAFERGVRSDRFCYIRNECPELPRTPPADAVRSPTFEAMRKLRDQKKLTPAQMDVFVKPRPQEELYDMQADPHALTNLASDPKHEHVLAQMRTVLAAWQKQTADVKPAILTPDKYDREMGRALKPAGTPAAK
jgi:N-sulfoglucosamine sulfohydrolase